MVESGKKKERKKEKKKEKENVKSKKKLVLFLAKMPRIDGVCESVLVWSNQVFLLLVFSVFLYLSLSLFFLFLFPLVSFQREKENNVFDENENYSGHNRTIA